MSERESLEQHLRYDHGWSRAELRGLAFMTDDELLEQHDKDHAGDLDPHRAGAKLASLSPTGDERYPYACDACGDNLSAEDVEAFHTCSRVDLVVSPPCERFVLPRIGWAP